MLSQNVGKYMGWASTILAVIGFFVWSIPLGLIAMVLSLIGLASPERGINWTALALGAIAVILGIL